MAALAVGTAATTLALAVLPWVRFPFDAYAVPALWLAGNLVPTLVGWALATVLWRGVTPGGVAAAV